MTKTRPTRFARAPDGHTAAVDTFRNPEPDDEDPVQALWRMENEERQGGE